MKKTFLAGLATLLPIAITLVVVVFVINLLTAPFVGFVEDLITEHGAIVLAESHKYTLIFISKTIVLIFFVLLIFFLGFLGRRIFFSWFINLTNKIFSKIPVIKTIYRISHEVSKQFFNEEKKKVFKETVTVPFPSEKTRALGLLSGTAPEEARGKGGDLHSVFIPTAPHPISGFLVMYDKKELQSTTIETEDLFKFLISCGIYHPGEKKSE